MRRFIETTGAALEDATYAPALDAAPSVGDDSSASSRATLIGFINGQAGVTNPPRQGTINSALLGEGDPLPLLRWNPSQGRYSSLWDVNPRPLKRHRGRERPEPPPDRRRGRAEPGRQGDPHRVGFANSGGLVFVDQASEEITTA